MIINGGKMQSTCGKRKNKKDLKKQKLFYGFEKA